MVFKGRDQIWLKLISSTSFVDAVLELFFFAVELLRCCQFPVLCIANIYSENAKEAKKVKTEGLRSKKVPF